MRRCVCFFFLFLSLGTMAQDDKKQLRDSLKAATELLAYHTDSIDLRLRKAAWNLQLGQWDYAKNEYDYVINRDRQISRHAIIVPLPMKNSNAIILLVSTMRPY